MRPIVLRDAAHKRTAISTPHEARQNISLPSRPRADLPVAPGRKLSVRGFPQLRRDESQARGVPHYALLQRTPDNFAFAHRDRLHLAADDSVEPSFALSPEDHVPLKNRVLDDAANRRDTGVVGASGLCILAILLSENHSLWCQRRFDSAVKQPV
jgi:hypothetical protein